MSLFLSLAQFYFAFKINITQPQLIRYLIPVLKMGEIREKRKNHCSYSGKTYKNTGIVWRRSA